MRSFNLSLLFAALLQFTRVALTVPTAIDPPSAILPRDQHCTNAPSSVAGTLAPPASPPHRPPRTLTISEATTQIWCGLGTRTYLVVRFVAALPREAVYDLLESSYEAILDVIDTLGDGVIRQGYYQHLGRGVELYTQNVNNRQQTWGVLGAAVAALQSYMESAEWNHGSVGSVQFSIYDGANEVARGTLGPE